MIFFPKATSMLEELKRHRRYIHRNAELSFEEFGTADYICKILEESRISHRRIAGTGVLARIDGRIGDPQHPIVLRADMDALPIREETPVEFASTNGAMHACGHDMHTTALLGALMMLNESREDFEGTILGLFQPGEELHPGGASIVLSEGIFEGMQPKAFIGQHVSPELAVGTFGFRSGTFMASTDEIHITVKGRGGHGAMPHLGADPVVATCAMIMSMQTIVSRNAEAQTPSVLSFGRIIADGATNIIPKEVLVEGTFRTMNEQWRAEAKRRIAQVAHSTAQAYGTEAVVDIKDGYPCVENNETLTLEAMTIGREVFGDQAILDIPKRMTAEDFGFYSVRYPSLFYRLGVGESAPLHNSMFCPDERALAYGAAMMATLAQRMV